MEKGEYQQKERYYKKYPNSSSGVDIYNNKNKQTKLLYEPDNRFQLAEERICELEDKTLKIPSLKEKKMKVKHLVDLWDTIKQTDINIMGVIEEERE